jgi:hypothetical protein
MNPGVPALIGALFLVSWTAPLTAVAANTAPSISGAPATSVRAFEQYNFRPVARDADRQWLRFAITNKPPWASFDRTTGRLHGTPKAAYAGITFGAIRISVSDGITRRYLPGFSIAVKPANRAPRMSGRPLTFVPAGWSYAFHPVARDPDGQRLVFTVANRPAWATFDRRSGRLAGRPARSLAGRLYRNIRVCASDGRAKACLPAFSIRIAASNRAPRISGTPSRTARVGAKYSFKPRTFDADRHRVWFLIVNKPVWATFDRRTGRLSGTPRAFHAGRVTRGVRIAVTDGYLKTWLPGYSLQVTGPPAGTAGSARLSWSAPTRNTDGSRLTNLRGYVIEYGTRRDQLNGRLDVRGEAVTSAVVEDLAPATWYFGVRAVSTAGIESRLSEVVSKTIP